MHTLRLQSLAAEPGPRRHQHSASAAAQIHSLALPLVGLEALEHVLPRATAAHRALALEQPQAGHWQLYDFLPAEPLAPATAITLLFGGSVKGVTRIRQLSRLPRGRSVQLGVVPDEQVGMHYCRQRHCNYDTIPDH